MQLAPGHEQNTALHPDTDEQTIIGLHLFAYELMFSLPNKTPEKIS